ncbi:Hypothetical predicted protein, partial [Pelobates cultripes]
TGHLLHLHRISRLHTSHVSPATHPGQEASSPAATGLLRVQKPAPAGLTVMGTLQAPFKTK